MPLEETLRLNTHFLVQRVRTLGLKQWWVAREVGVARKTVTRWMGGRVKRIRRESAQRLAEVLTCAPTDLTLPADADVLATREEQRRAADLIREHNLVALVSPGDQWQLAEGLIRAAMIPDLPLRELGYLYCDLSTVEWRQGRYDEARSHAERALEIAARVGDRLIEIKAMFNQATVDSFLGRSRAALAAYERVRAIPESFDSPGGRAGLHSNLGCMYRSFLRFEESVRSQRESIARYTELGADYNLGIAHTSLGVVLSECGRLDEALTAFTNAASHAASCNYARGVTSARIYEGDVLSLLGHHDRAVELVRTHLPDLARYEVYDLTAHECAARVFRRSGDLGAAREALAAGLVESVRFPEIDALLREELSRLEASVGDVGAAESARAAANASWRRAGVLERVTAAPLGEFGQGRTQGAGTHE